MDIEIVRANDREIEVRTASGRFRCTVAADGMVNTVGVHTDDEVTAALQASPAFLAAATAARRSALAREAAREAREEEVAWYALVTFGLPRLAEGVDDSVGRGIAARDRLIRVAQEAMGTGTCSAARIVRCASERDAREADISTASNVVFSA